VSGPTGSELQRRRRARGRNVAYSLFLADGLMGRLLEEELRAGAVSSTELGLLSAIGIQGAATPRRLAEHLGTRPTTLSSQIQAVIERGFVRRLENPDDGRSYLLELTPEGRQAWQGAWPALRSALHRVEAALDVPIDDVEETLVALERGLRRALGEAAPG
jgi:DNA-binding MarR family transcriptional regulator